MELVKQGVMLRLGQLPTRLQRRFGLTQPGIARLDWHRLRIPDSAIAREAEDVLRESSPVHLANHCHRTYLWGAVLAQHDALRYDEELLYVSCLLHDLGLTEKFNKVEAGSHCFALDGAIAAESITRKHWDQVRCDSMAEAITLHLNPSVNVGYGTEAHLLNAGAGLDVAGARKWEVARSTQDEVLQHYPRANFKQAIDKSLRKEATFRPCCRAHFLYDSLQFGELIKHASFSE